MTIKVQLLDDADDEVDKATAAFLRFARATADHGIHSDDPKVRKAAKKTYSRLRRFHERFRQ